jgi:CheY-like chemotaxis protein
VEGDPVRLEQIFCNLLNNAAKYTAERGRISLTVALEDDFVAIRIRDSGIGIPPEMLSRVFDLFTQLEVSLHRSEGGLGIGLTLVRDLVQLHGGTVEGHSAGRNRGSEFVVRLPLLREVPPFEELPQSAGPAEGAGHLRILMVEDNRDAAETLCKLLNRWGHEVRHFARGEPAIAAAPEFRPQVAILDIGLPGPDGYQIAMALRRQNHAGLHLLAMSGYGQAEDREQAREAGFDLRVSVWNDEQHTRDDERHTGKTNVAKPLSKANRFAQRNAINREKRHGTNNECAAVSARQHL